MRGLRGKRSAPKEIAEKWVEEALTYNYWRLVAERCEDQKFAERAPGETVFQENLSANAA